MKVISKYALLVAIAAMVATSAQAQQPPTPTPDPGPGSGGQTGEQCECKIHLLTEDEMKTIGPKVELKKVKLTLEPTGKTTDPPVDEWNGYDDLYRLAKATTTLEEDGTAEVGLKLKQGFEVYDGLPGADVAFGPNHVHPSGSVAYNIIFRTKRDPMRRVGIRLNGALFISATVSISGSIAQPGAFVPHISDSVSSVALSMSASHPLPKCVSENEQEIRESLTMTGNVNSEEDVSGNIAVTAGSEEDSAKGPDNKVVEKIGGTGSATYSIRISKHVYSGTATIAKTILIQGESNRDTLIIPVIINGSIAQNGMSDAGQAIGNVTADASLIWSGEATPCAMAQAAAPPVQGPPVIIIFPGGT
ncbi:MAG: hypothetical protein U0996_03165 [Planctomycetaceae bacterium]